MTTILGERPTNGRRHSHGVAPTNGSVASRHPAAVASLPAAVTAVVDLIKDYSLAARRVHALRAVSLQVKRSEFIAIRRPSGSAKSTFMNHIGCLSRPTSGSYQLDDVMLPTVYAGLSRDVRHQCGRRARESMGLGDRVHHRSNELSHWQQQRVAIARALVDAPTRILADEPIGNLGSPASEEILAILQQLNQGGATIVLVTHARHIATCCSRTLVFKDGVIVSDRPNCRAASAADAVAKRPTTLEEAA